MLKFRQVTKIWRPWTNPDSTGYPQQPISYPFIQDDPGEPVPGQVRGELR